MQIRLKKMAIRTATTIFWWWTQGGFFRFDFYPALIHTRIDDEKEKASERKETEREREREEKENSLFDSDFIREIVSLYLFRVFFLLLLEKPTKPKYNAMEDPMSQWLQPIGRWVSNSLAQMYNTLKYTHTHILRRLPSTRLSYPLSRLVYESEPFKISVILTFTHTLLTGSWAYIHSHKHTDRDRTIVGMSPLSQNFPFI